MGRKHKTIAIIISIIIVVSMIQYVFSSSLIFLSTDKETYTPGEKAVVILRNLGLRNVYTGIGDYRVEIYRNGHWKTYDTLTPNNHPDVLLQLYPGGTYKWTVNLGDAQPGKYRIVKEVSLSERFNSKIMLTAYFTVSPRD
ncbi:MAG: hypothetical protein GSR82_00835 [Desulfurococcales archaeon]|nr:hypothetical protein [Desulfurococcales archaeon]